MKRVIGWGFAAVALAAFAPSGAGASESKAAATESKAATSESRAAASESKATASESKATATESKAAASESKATASESKAAASEPRIVREPDRVVVRHKTTVDFNDVRLEGELTGPEGGYVPGRESTHFDSLLKPRTNFLEELEKSGEGL